MIKNYSDHKLHGFRLYMLAKIVDNMDLASWTYICTLAALNNEKTDTGDVDVFNGFNGKRP